MENKKNTLTHTEQTHIRENKSDSKPKPLENTQKQKQTHRTQSQNTKIQRTTHFRKKTHMQNNTHTSRHKQRSDKHIQKKNEEQWPDTNTNTDT